MEKMGARSLGWNLDGTKLKNTWGKWKRGVSYIVISGSVEPIWLWHKYYMHTCVYVYLILEDTYVYVCIVEYRCVSMYANAFVYSLKKQDKYHEYVINYLYVCLEIVLQARFWVNARRTCLWQDSYFQNSLNWG